MPEPMDEPFEPCSGAVGVDNVPFDVGISTAVVDELNRYQP